jgi:hypothetical protein
MKDTLEILETDDTYLKISSKGESPFLNSFLISLVLSVLFYFGVYELIIKNFSNLSFLTILSFNILAFLIIYFNIKFLKLLFFQAFDINYCFEKDSTGKFKYYFEVFNLKFSSKTFPTLNYIVPRNTSLLGKHGFFIYILNAKAKESLSWNNLLKSIYNLLNPPFIRVELRYHTYMESKNIAQRISREIEEFTKEDRKVYD